MPRSQPCCAPAAGLARVASRPRLGRSAGHGTALDRRSSPAGHPSPPWPSPAGSTPASAPSSPSRRRPAGLGLARVARPATSGLQFARVERQAAALQLDRATGGGGGGGGASARASSLVWRGRIAGARHGSRLRDSCDGALRPDFAGDHLLFSSPTASVVLPRDAKLAHVPGGTAPVRETKRDAESKNLERIC